MLGWFRAEAARPPAESVPRPVDLGQFFGQNLRATNALARVFGLVDDAHPTSAELFDDAVVRDGLAQQ